MDGDFRMKNLIIALIVMVFTNGQVLKGKASWYDETDRKAPMASGYMFDARRLECAHKSLPFGTNVKIHRQKTNLEVNCVISDRGPYIEGRIIDLAPAAARKLDMIRAGVVPVEVTIIQLGACRKYGCKFKRGEIAK